MINDASPMLTDLAPETQHLLDALDTIAKTLQRINADRMEHQVARLRDLWLSDDTPWHMLAETGATISMCWEEGGWRGRWILIDATAPSGHYHWFCNHHSEIPAMVSRWVTEREERA